MASILVVCTGNICRSPMAEGFLKRLLAAREPDIEVSSAGTAGWDGSEASAGAVAAAAERETDISPHRARRLARELIDEADLVLAMAAEHRDRAVALVPEAEAKAFTLKELVRLLEDLPEEADGGFAERIAAADSLRRKGFEGNPYDEDVADPIGMSDSTYRAVAWELDEWCERLVDGLLGRQPAPAAEEAAR